MQQHWDSFNSKKAVVASALRRCQGNLSKAARLLKMTTAQLQEHLEIPPEPDEKATRGEVREEQLRTAVLVVDRCEGNRAKAARKLGICPATLKSYLKKAETHLNLEPAPKVVVVKPPPQPRQPKTKAESTPRPKHNLKIKSLSPEVLKMTWLAYSHDDYCGKFRDRKCDCSRRRKTDLRNKLVEHYLRYAMRTAVWAASRNPLLQEEDFYTPAIFGLIDAVNAFNPERGTAFQTYCLPRIRGAIQDEQRSTDFVPRLVRRRAALLKKFTDEFHNNHERGPTDEELAEAGWPPEKVRDAKPQSCKNLLDEETDSDFDEPTNFKEYLTDPNAPKPGGRFHQDEFFRRITQCVSLEQQSILYLHYYRGTTFKIIGELFGLSESRISQLHSQTIDLLKDNSTQEDLLEWVRFLHLFQ